MRYYIILLSFLLSVLNSTAQSCYQSLKKQGDNALIKEVYEDAIRFYLAALNCTDRPGPQEDRIPELINRALQARVDQLNAAKTEASISAVANRNAVKALQKLRTNPTLALWFAYKNFTAHQEEPSAVAVFHQIISDTTNRFYRASFTDHDSGILSIAVSPNGQLLLIGGQDQTAKLLDFEGTVLQSFVGHTDVVSSVAFSPDGQYVLTGSRDNSAQLWDLEGNSIQTFNGHTYDIWAVAFSPDGQSILTGSKDGTAMLWDLEGNQDQTFVGHSKEVKSVAFSPDGQYILTTANDTSARLWNLQGEELHKFKEQNEYVRTASFSPDGQMVLIAAGNELAKLRDLEGNLIRTFKGHTGPIYSATFSKNGQYLLTGSYDHTAKLWDLQGNVMHTFKGHEQSVNSVAFLLDGQSIVTGSTDYTVKIWGLNNLGIRTTFAGHSSSIEGVAFSPDGQMVLTGSNDSTAILWDLNGKIIQLFDGHQDFIYDVAFSPDGQKLITGSWDATAKLWDLEGNVLQTFYGHEDAVNAVAFSPDGQMVLTGSVDATAKLWDLQGNVLQTFKGHTVSIGAVAFSPDGQKVLTGSGDETAKLWDLEGNELRTFKGHTFFIESVAFSPDGQQILTGSWDDHVKQWDLEGNELQTYTAHNRPVLAVAFSPDGQYVLSSSRDQTAKLLDLMGNEVQTFYGHTNYVKALAYAPDGLSILTGSDDHTAKLWDTYPNFLMKRVAEVSLSQLLSQGFELTEEEINLLKREGEETDWLAIGNSFFNQKNYERAKGFYQKVPKNLEAMIGLYRIGLAQNNPYSLSNFHSLDQFDDLNGAANFFYMERNWEAARPLYEKAWRIKPDAHVLIRLDNIAENIQESFDLKPYLLQLTSSNEIESIAYHQFIQREYEASIQSYEQYLEIVSDPYQLEKSFRTLLYVSFYWRDNQTFYPFDTAKLRIGGIVPSFINHPLLKGRDSLFRRDAVAICNFNGVKLINIQNFDLATLMFEIALELDSEEAYINRHYPLALLLSGKNFEEASSWYKQWKDKIWTATTAEKTFGEAFRNDISGMERAGWVPPERNTDVEKIKALLK